MRKLSTIAAAAAVGFAFVQPLAAQDSTPAALAVPDAARIAAAKVTIDYIFPAGTYARMFSGSFSQVMNQAMDGVANMPIADLVRSTGIPQEDIAKLGRATLSDVMEIVDPAYKQRQKATMDAMMPVLSNMMASMEPSMREALADVYAKRFTLEQLNDMNRFFATPSGTAYASNSMLIMMDPDVIGRISKDTPKMIQDFMAQLPAIEKTVNAATADLPKARSYADLTPDQKTRLANLLGVDEKDLAKGSAAPAGKPTARDFARQ
jgi:hypothetical protein